MSGWAAKQAKKAEWAEARKLDGLDSKEQSVNDTRDAAMGNADANSGLFRWRSGLAGGAASAARDGARILDFVG